MRSSKFIKVDKDILLEYIYDDDNYKSYDYRVIIDTLRDTRSFSNIENFNKTENQLFILDPTKNKYGIVDYTETNKYYNLQFQKYTGNVPFNYNIIRLHFPVNYTFNDKLGFLLKIGLNDINGKRYYLSNYYYDKTIVNRSNEIQFTSPPFLLQEKLWGKFIEIEIPSPINLINDVNIVNYVRTPKTATIHKNLLNSTTNVLSNEYPIFLDFQFLTKKSEILDKISYITTEPFSVTVPLIAEYEQLSLIVKEHETNDYFEIYGTYSDNISEFNKFITTQNKLGKSYYIIYDIVIFEKNIQTSTVSYLISDNFDMPVEFRPIIKFSTTTAIIDVTMKIINAVDDSVIIRKANHSMIQDSVSKYSKKLTKINISNTYKPKIYNSKPANINFTYSNNNQTKEKIEVPSAVMYDRYNINIKNISESVNDTTYYGLGLSQIIIYPSDNIFKFVIANGKDNNGYKPFSIPTDSSVYLQFKNDDSIVEVPLYFDSNEINLSNGVVVFLVNENYYKTIKTIYEKGYDQYYIVMKNILNITTIVYAGRFLIYQS